jgi:hypothetical protein
MLFVGFSPQKHRPIFSSPFCLSLSLQYPFGILFAVKHPKNRNATMWYSYYAYKSWSVGTLIVAVKV